MTGSTEADLTCKLVFKASGSKVNYTGRCTVTDLPSQSTSGSLTYNDSKKTYEVRSGRKTTTAKKTGNTLTFSLISKSIQGKATTTMALNPSSITVEAILLDNDGQTSKTRMTLKKS